MTVVKHYLDDPTIKHFYGSLAEMLALSTSGLGTGDRFFCYDSYLSYHYAAARGWLLWEKHTVS